MDRPDAMERKVSFNPEAATFSPVAVPATPAETPFATSGPPAAVAHDSPLQPITTSAEHNLVSANQNLKTISLDELASMGVSVEELRKTLEQHSSGQALNYIGGYFHAHLPSTSTFCNPMSLHTQSFMFPSSNIEPNFNNVDIDELNASLGLPGANPDLTPNKSPARGHRTRTSQRTYGDALYAQYMQSQSESSDETVRPPRQPPDTIRPLTTEEAPALRLVRPPPGFGDQLSRIVAEEAQQVSYDAVTTLPNTPRGPSEYFHPQPHVPSSAVPSQGQAYRTTTTRRIRSYTRTRRTDQGPEPSAADIYPDDAHWTPHSQATLRYQYPTPPYVPPAPPQPVVRSEDFTAWPTPAEVYDSKAKASTDAHATQITDTKEVHVPPTAEDFAAADAAVLSLLDELPEPRINTLLSFGALDLLGDERPLSPAQENGKRYGLNFYGIGLADPWQPPMASEGEQFRVRPRNHEGWGGWEWAMKNGWAMQ